MLHSKEIRVNNVRKIRGRKCVSAFAAAVGDEKNIKEKIFSFIYERKFKKI